jgi:iron complex transport system substrate-binding protein
LIAVLLVAAVAAPATAAGATAATEAGSSRCAFPFAATDATGTEVTVDEEPERIVTLNPSAAQTVWEIGGREKVVGVTRYASYLDGTAPKANVSAAGDSFVDAERVVSLDPDVVLAPSTVSNETVSKLRDTGQVVYKFRFQRSLDDVEAKTLLTGRLTGECDGAEATVARMEGERRTVRRAVEDEQKPRVLYVFFGYTAGEGTFAHRVIEAGGGVNVAAEANISGYRQVSPEVVVDADPQWIVVNDGATGIPSTDAYNSTYAVRNDQVVVLQEEYISQPAPRIVRSVVKLARTLHPDAYERAANATSTREASTSPSDDPTRTSVTATATTAAAATTATSQSTSTSAPGFGPVVAVVAAAASALAVRRRSG